MSDVILVTSLVLWSLNLLSQILLYNGISIQGTKDLLKQVLRAIPILYIMVLRVPKGGFTILRVCRQYLWGKGEQKSGKIAPSGIDNHHQIERGMGLGIHIFQQQAWLLKLRSATQLVVGQDTEWINMVKDLMPRPV